jgi:4-oxalomesaconate hydratase
VELSQCIIKGAIGSGCSASPVGNVGNPRACGNKESHSKKLKKFARTRRARPLEYSGAEIRFFDAGDYPLEPTKELRDAIVQEFRAYRPKFILTHSLEDPYNADHPRVAQLVLECRILAQAHGYPSEHMVIGAPPVFLFEPHQPEQCNFKIQALLDITPVFEQKRKAMECMEAQEHLWVYYTDVAKRRGVQAVRNGGEQSIVYAEAYQRIYPTVGSEFV